MAEKTVLNCENCENESCMNILPVLKDLPEHLRQDMQQYMKTDHFEKGEYLFRENDPADRILIIRSGRIKIGRVDSDGNERILDILHCGEVIWDSLTEGQTVFPYSAAALTEVDLCMIDGETFMKTMSDHPYAVVDLIRALGRRLREANEKALLLSIQNPMKRLAGFLLDRDIRCVGPEINLKLEDIASSIGMRPETVSRNLSKLEKQGMIRRIGKGRILVTDRNALEEIYEEQS